MLTWFPTELSSPLFFPLLSLLSTELMFLGNILTWQKLNRHKYAKKSLQKVPRTNHEMSEVYNEIIIVQMCATSTTLNIFLSEFYQLIFKRYLGRTWMASYPTEIVYIPSHCNYWLGLTWSNDLQLRTLSSHPLLLGMNRWRRMRIQAENDCQMSSSISLHNSSRDCKVVVEL